MKTKKLVTLLKKAYAAEHETVQNYLANSAWLDGIGAHEVAEALAKDVPDELGHAQQLAHRLKQIGECPPGSMDLDRTQIGLQPSLDPTDVRHVLKGAIAAEHDAIDTYRDIIDVADTVDPVTQDLAIKLLADEDGHRTLLEGFLKSLDREEARPNFTEAHAIH